MGTEKMQEVSWIQPGNRSLPTLTVTDGTHPCMMKTNNCILPGPILKFLFCLMTSLVTEGF